KVEGAFPGLKRRRFPEYFHILEHDVSGPAEVQGVLGLIIGSGRVGREEQFDVVQGNSFQPALGMAMKKRRAFRARNDIANGDIADRTRWRFARLDGLLIEFTHSSNAETEGLPVTRPEPIEPIA